MAELGDGDFVAPHEHGLDDEGARDSAAITVLFGLSNRPANATGAAARLTIKNKPAPRGDGRYAPSMPLESDIRQISPFFGAARACHQGFGFLTLPMMLGS